MEGNDLITAQSALMREREEKRILENAMNKQKAEFNAIFQNLADAYLMTDLSGQVHKMSDLAKQLLGYDCDTEEFNIMQIALQSEYTHNANAFSNLLKEGTITNFQSHIRSNDNTIKYVQVNASIIYDENKNPIKVQGIIRDITESHQKHQKLIKAEKFKYERIINNTNLGLLEVDGFDNIKTINKRLLRMYGLTEEEVIGKRVRDLFPTEKVLNLLDNVRSRINEEQSESFDFSFDTKSHGKRHWIISVSPNYNINGKVTGYIVGHLDITHLKRLEYQKDALLKKLSKSNEELQDYAHMVSHDLKAPLRNIDAMVAWFKDDYKDKIGADGLETLDIIRATVEKMEHLIRGILVYSSLNFEKVELYDINLNKLVDEICTILGIPENTKVNIVDKLPIVKGDKYRFLQLFQNLIHNAIAFNNKPNATVDISCEDLGNYWKFCVEDNGEGIEAKYLKKIFEVFQKLNDEYRSSGIGLSIVKKVVEIYEGEIYAESEPGKGTKIFFTLKKF